MIHPDTLQYHAALSPDVRAICDLLAREIDRHLPAAENKIWHAHPVWFLDGNPIVGYSKLKHCVRLLFWSGQSFDEEGLAEEGSFKAAEARYITASQVDTKDLKRWLTKTRAGGCAAAQPVAAPTGHATWIVQPGRGRWPRMVRG